MSRTPSTALPRRDSRLVRATAALLLSASLGMFLFYDANPLRTGAPLVIAAAPLGR